MGIKEKLDPASAKEKSKELWGNRRKFLSRGFIGSLVVLGGSASTSRGLVGLSINNSEEILESPAVLPRIPSYVDDVPEALVNAGKEVAEHSKKIASTRVDWSETCWNKGEQRKAYLLIDSPYVSELNEYRCYETKEESVDAERRRLLALQTTQNDSPKKPVQSSSDAKEIFRMGAGVLMIASGYAVARGRDVDGRLSRRELFKRAQKGAAMGIVWNMMDRTNLDSLVENLVDSGTDNVND